MRLLPLTNKKPLNSISLWRNRPIRFFAGDLVLANEKALFLAMPPKKRKADTLTGGTDDVNPQLMTLWITQTGVDTATHVENVLPVSRIPGEEETTVMEILKVFFESSDFTIRETDQTKEQLCLLSTGGPASATTDPKVFAFYSVDGREGWVTTATGTAVGTTMKQEPYIVDLTDGAGHGILIATDTVFINLVSSNIGVAVSATCKILYRFKRVSIVEYVGIVQSQQ